MDQDILEQIVDMYPLTRMQQGMLFHNLAGTQNGEYFIQVCYQIEADNYDREIFYQALQLLTMEFDVLRTKILYDSLDEPLQVVLNEVELDVKEIDITDSYQWEEKLNRIKEEDVRRGFQLEEDQLFRVILVKCPNQSYQMVWSIHHIIVDGWSNAILLGKLLNYYNRLREGEGISVLKAEIMEGKENQETYGDYVRWISELSQEEAVGYWKGVLEDYQESVNIKSTGERTDSEHLVETITRVIPASMLEQMEEFSKTHKITVNTLMEATIGILLQRYNYTEDVVFGKVVSGRNAPFHEIEDMVGLFINTIPIRVKTNREMTVEELLQNIWKQSMDSSQYDNVSISELQEKAGLDSKAIQTILAFENYYTDGTLVREANKAHATLCAEREQTNFDITFQVLREEQLSIQIMYKPELYSEKQIQTILERMELVLSQMIEEPQKKISELSCITKEEEQKIIGEFNATDAVFPKEETIVSLFEQMASDYSQRTALTFKNQSITYEELNKRANNVAHKLLEQGVSKNQYVVMLTKRSIDMLVGILGILKVGAVYVPVDPTYPEQRIQYIIEDCNAKAVVSYDYEGELSIPSISLEECSWNKEYANPELAAKPDDVAYVIYTSGTTGNPKGVQVTHKNVVRLLKNDHFAFDFTCEDVWLLFHSYCFDFSVWEIFGALLSGARLVVLTKEEAIDGDKVRDIVAAEKVTVLNQVPTAFFTIFDHPEKKEYAIRYVIFGGEALYPDKLKRFSELYPSINIINMYGITETTVHVTYKEILSQEIETGKSNIGRAIPTLKVYVMNDMQLCGIGMPGELCVTGDGVARGYLNREELTNQKFVENPFGEGKMYRSGDLVQWLPNGELEYLGRIDEQIKIRGFRIELGEIQSAIRNIPNVTDVAVVKRRVNTGEDSICAYIVSDQKLDMDIIREELGKHLTDYMIPAYMMQIDALPVTRNGKLDRKNLPEMKVETAEEYIAPRNAEEEAVIQVFHEIFNVERISMKDTFFQLGGDSIKAIRVVSKLHEAGYRVTVKDVMTLRTAERLAAKLKKDEEESVQEENVYGEVELTPIMHWFFEQPFAHREHFNQTMVLKSKHFEQEAVKSSMEAIVESHDMLRAVYKEQKLVIREKGEEDVFDFQVVELPSDSEKSIGEFIESVGTKEQAQLDLANGPLVKLVLFQGKEEHLLFIIHHLLVDGVSWRILLEDFISGYNQYRKSNSIQLGRKTDSYKAWAQALMEYSESKKLLSELKYWTGVCQNSNALSIKAETSQPSQVKELKVSLSESLTSQLLHDANNTYHTEINDLLLTALGMAIYQVCGQKMVSVKLEGHGREEIHKEMNVDRTIGWFTSMYPINLETTGDIAADIVNIKEMYRKIPNKGLGYGVLKYLGQYQELDGMEMDVIFNYLGDFEEELSQNEIQMSPYSGGETSAKDNLVGSTMAWNGQIVQGKLEFSVEFDTKWYQESMVQALADAYMVKLAEVIEHCCQSEKEVKTASDFDLLDFSGEDFEQLMNEIGKLI